jgi:putative CocE/NonD family hydrolase
MTMRAVALTAALLFFLPGTGASQTYPVKMEFDVRVRMPDGITLSADVYRPDAPGKFPVILVRTPYDNGTAPNVRRGKFWASRGYAYVVQDVRGRGDSDGEFYPLIHEAVDGDATVTWAATQPWSDGKVGTFGASYLGWTQGYLATIPNEHLAAMILVVIPTDPWRNFPYWNGTISPAVVSWIAQESGHTQQDLSETDVMGSMYHLPLREADTRMGRVMKVWRDWIDHPMLDDYWRNQGYQEKLLNTRVPILHVTGWYDDVLAGTLENFVNMTTRATDPEERRRQWLVIGPWPHATNSTTQLAGVDFGPRALIDYDTLQIRFFDHWLKGKQNGFENDPHARIFVMGPNVWRDENEWPLARTRYTKYYLHSAGRANTGQGDGSLSTAAPSNEKPDHYDYDPADPAPFMGVSSYAQLGSADDYRPAESRNDVLVFSTPPVTQSLEVCGPVHAQLFASTSAKDTDWIARLIDVHPNGYAQRLREGIMRARFHKSIEHEDFVPPGQIEAFDLDLLSTCVRLLEGHRLRVEVTSSSLPLFDRNMNTGGKFGVETQGVVAHQTIYHDAQHPSHVIVPIVDTPRP